MEGFSGRIPNISSLEATGMDGKDSAHSFGLHSPEQLPCSEDEFKKLACSFGLHSPEAVSPECIHPSYNPRLFSDGQLYFDPEIIDLTLIPPPVTPDEKDTLMDFSSPTMAVPPPEFKDRNSPSICQRSESPSFMMDLPSPIRDKIDAMIQNDEDLSNHMAVIDALVSAELNRDRKASEKDPRVSENESDSGNETIASDNVELGHSHISDVIDLSSLAVTEDQPLPHDLDALDIDAFIASMTVPPPPNNGSLNRADIISTSGGTSVYLESVLTKISDGTSETDKDTLVSTSSPCRLPSSSEADHMNCIKTNAEGTDTLSSSTSGFPSEPFSTKEYSALELDEEIAKLVIPPPPVTSDAVLTEIPVVPPVSEVENMEEEKQKDTAPFDSPTALEGTRLVESLRAEYEHRLGSSPSTSSAHEHSALANQDSDGNQSFSASSPYKKGLWQPTLVSKSADSSPLHQGTESLAHSRVHNSIGTLPRLLRKRETPPPPPPRRSSMQPQLEKIRVRTSENIGSASLRHVVHQRSFSVPEESTSCPPVTDSSRSLWNTGVPQSDSSTKQSVASGQQSSAIQEKSVEKDQQSRVMKNILTPAASRSSPTLTKQSIAEEAAAVANKFTAMRRMPQKVKARSATIERDMTGSKIQSTFIPSRESLVSKSVTLDRDCSHNLHDMLEVSRSVDDINLQAYKDYKRSSSVSSSDSTKSSSTDSSTRFQSFKSKLKSYVAPSIYKKQQIFSRSSGKDKSDKSDLGVELHKSEYLNTSACSSPAPNSPHSSVSHHVAAFSEFTTGQHSPLSPRKSHLRDEQSSFTDSSDTKATVKTFRTFLGDKSGASPPSVHKTAGIRTSLPHTKVEIPGLSKEKVVSSPKKVALPVVNLSTSVANVSISSAEELSTAQQSVTIPKGRVLVKVPPAQGVHNGDSSENQVSGDMPSVEHVAAGSGNVPASEAGASDKVRAIRSELESKLDYKHFARETSHGSVSSERGEEMLGALEVFAKYVQSHEYAGDTTFTDANHDVDHMIGQLTEMMNKRLSRMSDRVAAADMKALKDSLIQNSRTFVTDSKLLVSSATQSRQKLVHHVNCSIHTLAKILYKSGQVITILNNRDNLKAFGSKVAEVAKAYTVTVEAAAEAAGKPLSDPNMKLLMKRATSLAAILSSFMKTLKALETS